jgi:NADH-quinone oxidoreductase subunit I
MTDHGHKETKDKGTPFPFKVKRVARDGDASERVFLPAIAAGLGATVRHFFRNVLGGKDKYTRTVQYPDQKVEYPPRFRGMHRLVPREDGSPRCVACFMCQTACPARCIHIVAGETKDHSIEKFPIVFEIDELRCVVCGLCVEACPCDAIRMDTGVHPEPTYTRSEADFAKTDLLSFFGREEVGKGRSKAKPPPSAAGTGRVDRSRGDRGAGGAHGGY